MFIFFQIWHDIYGNWFLEFIKTTLLIARGEFVYEVANLRWLLHPTWSAWKAVRCEQRLCQFDLLVCTCHIVERNVIGERHPPAVASANQHIPAQRLMCSTVPLLTARPNAPPDPTLRATATAAWSNDKQNATSFQHCQATGNRWADWRRPGRCFAVAGEFDYFAVWMRFCVDETPGEDGSQLLKWQSAVVQVTKRVEPSSGWTHVHIRNSWVQTWHQLVHLNYII